MTVTNDWRSEVHGPNLTNVKQAQPQTVGRGETQRTQNVIAAEKLGLRVTQ